MISRLHVRSAKADRSLRRPSRCVFFLTLNCVEIQTEIVLGKIFIDGGDDESSPPSIMTEGHRHNFQVASGTEDAMGVWKGD